MQNGMRNCPGYDHCAGVSEVIGSVLLISLVVAGAAIVGIVLLSQQTPTKIPNVNFMVGQDSSGTKLYLYHNGGESLKNGTFSVFVDGVTKPYLILGGTDNWSLGKNLCLTISSPPRQVQVIYNTAGSGATVLSSASVNVSTTPGFTPADISATAPLPNYCTLCDLNTIPDRVAQGYMTNLTSDYILFGRNNKSDVPVGGFFNFTVNSPGNISTGTTPSPFPLVNGDQVAINQRAATAYRIFMIGNNIWELGALTVDVRIKFASNGTTRQIVNNGNVANAWVPGCTVGSTISITSTAGGTGSDVLLVMNNSIKINGANSSAINVINPRPTKAGLFSLVHDPTTNYVYFVGDADSVTINGNPVA